MANQNQSAARTTRADHLVCCGNRFYSRWEYMEHRNRVHGGNNPHHPNHLARHHDSQRLQRVRQRRAAALAPPAPGPAAPQVLPAPPALSVPGPAAPPALPEPSPAALPALPAPAPDLATPQAPAPGPVAPPAACPTAPPAPRPSAPPAPRPSAPPAPLPSAPPAPLPSAPPAPLVLTVAAPSPLGGRDTEESKMEQTFIMIKPDGVKRGLVGEIISRFEKKGFTLPAPLPSAPPAPLPSAPPAPLPSAPPAPLVLTVAAPSPLGGRDTEESKMEQTFIMIKPDGVQRGLVGEIISRFEKKGFTIKALKFLNVDQPFAEKHYAYFSAKPFLNGLISGPVVAMVWEGKRVVKTAMTIIGETNPAASAPGTIRGDFAIDINRNVIHGSDAVESAEKEIALWFPEGLANWQSSLHSWIYE